MNVKRNRNKKARLRLVALPLAGLLAASPAVAQSDILANTDVRLDATTRAVEAVLPSVVNIATSTVRQYADFYDPIFREFYGPIVRREEPNSIGSGVIVDEDGYILTNLHVLQRASRAQVKLWDGRIYDVESQYIASPDSDLALLKLRKKSPDEKFKAIKFARDDDLLLGETVIALGDPFGLGGSVSRGILSSKDRRPPVGDEPLNVENWLQTDAAINPGNSGGPLVDLRGEMIGVNVAIYPRGHGIGFAIPIKVVSAALSDFFRPERTASLWFGARVRRAPSALTVSSIQENSPADKAGMRVGDQIVEVNGEKPASLEEFNLAISDGASHDVSIAVRRGGERLQFKTTLVPLEQIIRQKMGLKLEPLTDENAAQVGMRGGEGLLIDEVEPNGPAEQAKLQRGYVIKEIDGSDTPDIVAASDILAGKQPGDEVQLTVGTLRRISNVFLQKVEGHVSLKIR